jgi:hypothetical protein
MPPVQILYETPMDRTREPRTQDCHNFLNSAAFNQYAKDFHGSYVRACYRVSLEPNDRANWPLNWEKIGRFCQMFWETLPDQSVIRKGAFFDLCNFAEDYTFGDHGI